MKIVSIGSVLVLAGCIASPVTPLDDSNYVVSVHTVVGAPLRSNLLAKATNEAEDYCVAKGKVAHVRNAMTSGIVGLTSLSSEVVFSCEPAPTPSAQR